MKNTLKINHENTTIVMDRTFAKAASIVGSAEYILLQGARKDYPTYTVVRRHIKTNPNKECYKGLTYDYMKEYIATHDNAKQNMATFKEKLLLAECHSIRYPTIKKWFLNTYTEVANFGQEITAEKAAEITKFPAMGVA